MAEKSPRDGSAGPLDMFRGAVDGVAGLVADGADGAIGFVKGMVPDLGHRIERGDLARLRNDEGEYLAPNPILDARETRELGELSDRYEKLMAPGALAGLGESVLGLVPEQLKDTARQVVADVTEQRLYEQMMEVVADGFGVLERAAAAAAVSDQLALDAFRESGGFELSSLDEICFLRAYEVARVAGAQNIQHTLAAFLEGGVTGAVGFTGIPFNIVLGTFLYYRAVQSVALFYGYDTKNDSAELAIAGEVLSAALAPRGALLGGNAAVVGKVMALAEVAVVGQTVKRGWTAMARRGGACLLITQMRALAHASAQKALVKAGKSGLEKSVFRNVLEQIGRYLPQKVVQRGVPVVGGAIGALFDAGQMQRILSIADVFYHKRLLVEKELRVMSLISGVNLKEGLERISVDDVA